MADLEAFTSVLAVLSAALLLVMAAVATKQFLWKRPRPIPVERRRRDATEPRNLE